MTTLLDVVKSYLNEAEVSVNKTSRLLEIGKRGIEDLHMDVSGLPTTTELLINSNTLTANLPKDYISYRKIGYERAGVIIAFAENPRIKLYSDNGECFDNNQNKNLQTIGMGTSSPYSYLYWMPMVSQVAPNGIVGGFSNTGGEGAYICDFRIDELNGLVQFGINPQVRIFMEYLANAQMVNGEYVVHPFDKAALLAWLAWRDIANKQGVPAGEKERLKYDYYRERGQARKRHYNLNLSKAYQKVRATNKATVQY